MPRQPNGTGVTIVKKRSLLGLAIGILCLLATALHADTGQQLEATSLRDLVEKVRGIEGIGTEHEGAEVVPVLFILESDEQVYEMGGVVDPSGIVSNVKSATQATSATTATSAWKRKPSKGIVASLDSGKSAVSSLQDALTPVGATVEKRASSHICAIRDKSTVKDAKWGLDVELGSDAGAPLTFRQANALLIKSYYWEVGPHTMPAQYREAVSRLCDCEDTVVWDGHREGKTVRDLLFAVLSHAHKWEVARRGGNKASYQVLPSNSLKDGVMQWTLLGF